MSPFKILERTLSIERSYSEDLSSTYDEKEKDILKATVTWPFYSGGKKRIKSYHVKYMQILKRLFKLMDRAALHASTIEFTHPENNEKISFSVPFPDDFKSVLGLLENE